MSSLIRSSRRAYADPERGYALLSTLVLAVLFFALISLVLWESALRSRSAQSFRSRIVAQTLAEDAAELAARAIGDGTSPSVSEESDEGTMEAKGATTTDIDGTTRFKIEAEGSSRGVQRAHATVTVRGRVEQGALRVTQTRHSQ